MAVAAAGEDPRELKHHEWARKEDARGNCPQTKKNFQRRNLPHDCFKREIRSNQKMSNGPGMWVQTQDPMKHPDVLKTDWNLGECGRAAVGKRDPETACNNLPESAGCAWMKEKQPKHYSLSGYDSSKKEYVKGKEGSEQCVAIDPRVKSCAQARRDAHYLPENRELAKDFENGAPDCGALRGKNNHIRRKGGLLYENTLTDQVGDWKFGHVTTKFNYAFSSRGGQAPGNDLNAIVGQVDPDTGKEWADRYPVEWTGSDVVYGAGPGGMYENYPDTATVDSYGAAIRRGEVGPSFGKTIKYGGVGEVDNVGDPILAEVPQPGLDNAQQGANTCWSRLNWYYEGDPRHNLTPLKNKRLTRGAVNEIKKCGAKMRAAKKVALESDSKIPQMGVFCGKCNDAAVAEGMCSKEELGDDLKDACGEWGGTCRALSTGESGTLRKAILFERSGGPASGSSPVGNWCDEQNLPGCWNKPIKDYKFCDCNGNKDKLLEQGHLGGLYKEDTPWGLGNPRDVKYGVMGKSYVGWQAKDWYPEAQRLTLEEELGCQNYDSATDTGGDWHSLACRQRAGIAADTGKGRREGKDIQGFPANRTDFYEIEPPWTTQEFDDESCEGWQCPKPLDPHPYADANKVYAQEKLPEGTDPREHNVQTYLCINNPDRGMCDKCGEYPGGTKATVEWGSGDRMWKDQEWDNMVNSVGQYDGECCWGVPKDTPSVKGQTKGFSKCYENAADANMDYPVHKVKLHKGKYKYDAAATKLQVPSGDKNWNKTAKTRSVEADWVAEDYLAGWGELQFTSSLGEDYQ
tara:strand:+ start:897 stop:3296 length:2400 start_codon:yes stop_codon:yes gene_type:complete